MRPFSNAVVSTLSSEGLVVMYLPSLQTKSNKPEKDALEGIIGDNVDATNSLIENLDVKPGFEKALDALLGDELYHSLDTKNDIHWKKLSIKEKSQNLPSGCKPLSEFVHGSDVLNERLNQTGLVINQMVKSFPPN